MYKLSKNMFKSAIIVLSVSFLAISLVEAAGVFTFNNNNNTLQFDDDVVLKNDSSGTMFLDALISRVNKDLELTVNGSVEVVSESDVAINTSLEITPSDIRIPGDLIAGSGQLKIGNNLNIKLDDTNLTFYDGVNSLPLVVSKVLASSNTSDISKVPSDGIYVKGVLSVAGDLTFGINPGSASYKVDVAGKMNSTSFCVKDYCWNQLLAIPNNLLKIDTGASVVNDLLATFDSSGNLKNSTKSWSSVLKIDHKHDATHFVNGTLTNANVSTAAAITRDKIAACSVSNGTAKKYRSFVGFWDLDSQNECNTYCTNSHSAEVGLWLDMTGVNDLCMCFDEVDICI